MKNLLGALVVGLLAPAVAGATGVPPPDSDTAPPPAVQPADAPAAATAPVKATPATAAAAPARPAPVSSVAATAADQRGDRKSGFSMGAELGHSVSSGTFARPEYYSYVGAGLGLSPSYAFNPNGVSMVASASASVGWEYTLPDNLNGRRFSWGDLRLGLSAPGVFKEKTTGISITPSLGFLVPTSLESIAASTITVISGNVSVRRTFFDKLSLGYSLGGSAGLHGSQVGGAGKPYVTSSALGTGPLPVAEQRTCIGRPTEQRCLTGTNTQYSISNSLSASYAVMDKLTVAMSWALSNSFRYAQPDDEYTSEKLTVDGEPAAKPGFGRTDSMSGGLSVSYSINEHLGASLAMATGGTPKTADNKNWRFPFFDFLGPEAGRTSFSLGVSASF